MPNQLSKGVVQAGEVRADVIKLAGSALSPTVYQLDDIFPAAPVAVATPGAIAAALETLGLVTDNTTTPVEVTGDRSDGTALVNLLNALEALGLITDSTVA